MPTEPVDARYRDPSNASILDVVYQSGVAPGALLSPTVIGSWDFAPAYNPVGPDKCGLIGDRRKIGAELAINGTVVSSKEDCRQRETPDRAVGVAANPEFDLTANAPTQPGNHTATFRLYLTDSDTTLDTFETTLVVLGDDDGDENGNGDDDGQQQPPDDDEFPTAEVVIGAIAGGVLRGGSELLPWRRFL